MQLRWTNGMLNVGPLWCRDAVGIELAWGRRDLMGEDVLPYESIFADHCTLVLATGLEQRIHGSVWRAAIARWLGV